MANIDIVLSEPVGTINPNVYGHFTEHLGSCVYGGLWCGGKLLEEAVELIRRINPPVIRWPGGCFADDYHWRDGIGPAGQRPRRVNMHWGQVVESNEFGTHEFIALCRAVGAQPYLCGNVGSGTPAELRQWVEYCNYPGGSTLSDERIANGAAEPFGVKYWGVGNESWGCGGSFTPEDYASEYRRFSMYCPSFGDTPLYLIACGPDGNDLDWTRRFFEKLHKDYRQHNRIHGYAPHYYCGTAGPTATEFAPLDWYELLQKATLMEDLVVQQRAVMDGFDPQRRIGMCIDEWGAWHMPTPGRNAAFLWQQNTLRDALVAAITLDVFNRHADKVAMANIAQLVNVLQALLLVEEGKVVATPTYHVYELYKNHQGARSVRTLVEAPRIEFEYGGRHKSMAGLMGSASIKGRTLTLTVVNPHIARPVPTTINLRGPGSAALVRETVLTHSTIQAHNSFQEPEQVKPTDPRPMSVSGQSLEYTFRGQSVTRLEMAMV